MSQPSPSASKGATCAATLLVGGSWPDAPPDTSRSMLTLISFIDAPLAAALDEADQTTFLALLERL